MAVKVTNAEKGKQDVLISTAAPTRAVFVRAMRDRLGYRGPLSIPEGMAELARQGRDRFLTNSDGIGL